MPYKNPEQQKAYQTGYIAAKRSAWLEANGPCVQCGSWERLEVDHIDPAEKVTHRVWSLSRDQRLAELAKCQVLCHSCHKAKTIAQFRRPVVHGTLTTYKHHRCRCDLCRAANTKRARDRKHDQHAA